MAESTLTIKIQDDGGTPGGKSGAGTQPAPASPKPTPVPLPKPKPVDLPYYPPGPLPSAANLDPAKEKEDKKSSGFDGRSIIAGITETLADSVRNPMTSMQGIVGKILEKIAEQGKRAEEKMQRPKPVPVPKPDTAKAVQPAKDRIEKTKQIIKQNLEDKKANGNSMQWDRLRKPQNPPRPKPKSIYKPVPQKVPTNMGTKARAGVAVAGRVAGAAGLLVSSIKMMTDAFLERAKQLRDYSADIAASGARAEVRGIQADIKEAQTLGPGMARLEDSTDQIWHEVRDVLLPIKKFVVDVLAGMMETVLLGVRVVTNMPALLKELFEQTWAFLTGLAAGNQAAMDHALDTLRKRVEFILKEPKPEGDGMFDEFFTGPPLVQNNIGVGGAF